MQLYGHHTLAILKHIWVSESNWKITQWSLRWEVLWELDVYWVHTTLPDCAILSGDFTLPVKEVHSTCTSHVLSLHMAAVSSSQKVNKCAASFAKDAGSVQLGL